MKTKTFNVTCDLLVQSSVNIFSAFSNGVQLGIFSIDCNDKSNFVPTKTFSFIYEENHGAAVTAFENAMLNRLEIGLIEETMVLEVTV